MAKVPNFVGYLCTEQNKDVGRTFDTISKALMRNVNAIFIRSEVAVSCHSTSRYLPRYASFGYMGHRMQCLGRMIDTLRHADPLDSGRHINYDLDVMRNIALASDPDFNLIKHFLQAFSTMQALVVTKRSLIENYDLIEALVDVSACKVLLAQEENKEWVFDELEFNKVELKAYADTNTIKRTYAVSRMQAAIAWAWRSRGLDPDGRCVEIIRAFFAMRHLVRSDLPNDTEQQYTDSLLAMSDTILATTLDIMNGNLSKNVWEKFGNNLAECLPTVYTKMVSDIEDIDFADYKSALERLQKRLDNESLSGPDYSLGKLGRALGSQSYLLCRRNLNALEILRRITDRDKFKSQLRIWYHSPFTYFPEI